MKEFTHDYPDRMTPEQARAFRDAVLNIVSQIPRGRVTTVISLLWRVGLAIRVW